VERSRYLGNSSGETLGTYDSQLLLHLVPHFGINPVTGISTAAIRKWVCKLSEQGIGATTIRQSYRLMRQIMESAFIEERISRNPRAGIKLPKIFTAENEASHAKNLLRSPESATSAARSSCS
jgi:site-specific recombinase XerC